MKILIVEDNPLFANDIELAGKELAMSADHATDGWEAIEMLETGDYAAIVIDSDLPRQSGFGVLTYLREEVGAELDNVVFLTSSDEDEVRRKVDTRVNVVARSEARNALARVVRSARSGGEE